MIGVNLTEITIYYNVKVAQRHQRIVNISHIFVSNNNNNTYFSKRDVFIFSDRFIFLKQISRDHHVFQPFITILYVVSEKQ